MTKRAERLTVLFLVAGFFLFLVVSSCKNENLIDPLDILDKDNPEMWPASASCGVSASSSQPKLAPPPGEGEVPIWTGPNPTSEPICIEYVLASEVNVSLAIYTEKGERVISIVRERLPAGDYVHFWNLDDESGNQVDNGTYRAYFMAGSYVTHGDIIVQR